MRNFAFFILFFIFAPIYSQTIQPCVVMEYNERQAKTPLANVVLNIKNAGAALSNGNGECTLSFPSLKLGDRVEYSPGCITRKGYEVFNNDALEQWTLSGSKNTFRIVMCKSERFKRICDSYLATMSANYRKQRDKELEEIKKLKKELDKERSDYQSTIAELDGRIQEIQDEYEKLEREIAEQAEKFARIDLSEMNTIEAEALELMQNGDIEGAIRVYETLNLVGKKSQNLDSRNTAYNNITQMWEAINEYRLENERINESLKRQIEIYKAKGDKVSRHKADSTFRVAAFADTTDIDLLKDFYTYASNRNMTDDKQRAANIVYSYYVGEFEGSPEEMVLKYFDDIETALAWVRSHKLSVECLKKVDGPNDSKYLFEIDSKQSICPAILKWINSSTASVDNKKKILEEIVTLCKKNEYIDDLKNALQKQLELADSIERWTIIQNLIDIRNEEDPLIFSHLYTSLWGESDLISTALEVTPAKEVETFLHSVEKKYKKKFKIAKKKIEEIEKTYIKTSSFNSLAEIKERSTYIELRKIDSSIRYWSLIENSSDELESVMFTDSLGQIVVSPSAENFIKVKYEISKAERCATAYNSIEYDLWKYYELTGSTKKLKDYEKEIVQMYKFQKKMASSPDESALYNFYWYYRKKGDTEKSRMFQRVYDEEEVFMAEFLEKGDTLSAIKHKIELAERAEPTDLDLATYSELSEYATKLSDVCELCTELKDYVMAESYALRALEVAEKLKDNWSKHRPYSFLTRIYQRTQQWNKAVAAMKKEMETNEYCDNNLAIAKIYWEHLKDASNALIYLQIVLDNYDKRFEESSTSPVLNGMSNSYGNIITYMHHVYLASNTGSERDWIEILKTQLRTYDSLIQYQEYVEDNNAHFLRSMIISSYATLQDSVACMEFLNERAGRIKTIYEEHPTKSMLYAYADAVAYDYYHFYELMGNFEKTEYYALNAIEIYKQVCEDYSKLEPLANMYRMLVLRYEEQGINEKVVEYCELALPLYLRLEKYSPLVTYLYIAHAWANYKMFPNDEERYVESLEKGCEYDNLLKGLNYINSDIVKKRITVMVTPINSLLAKLSSYDDQNNYEGYEDWRHEIHQLRSSIITYFLAAEEEEACLAFLDKRAADILRKRENDNSSTMLYVCADAVGYDYYSYYRQVGNIEKAEEYALVAIDIYEHIHNIYKNINPLQNMYRELWQLFRNDSAKGLYYEEKYQKCQQ